MWDEARKLAQDDLEVGLSSENLAYSPSSVLEDEENELLGDDSIAEKVLDQGSRTAGSLRGALLYRSVLPSSRQRPFPLLYNALLLAKLIALAMIDL